MKLLSILALVLSCFTSYGDEEKKTTPEEERTSFELARMYNMGLQIEQKDALKSSNKLPVKKGIKQKEEIEELKPVTESQLARRIIALQNELEELEQDTSLTEEEKEIQKDMKERRLQVLKLRIATKRRELARRRADIIERGNLREEEARDVLRNAQDNLYNAIKNSKSEEELAAARRAVARAERRLNIQKVTRGESVTEATGLNECTTCNDIASSALADVGRHDDTNPKPKVTEDSRAGSQGEKSGVRY